MGYISSDKKVCPDCGKVLTDLYADCPCEKKKPLPDLPPEEYLTRDGWRVILEDGKFLLVSISGLVPSVELPPGLGAPFMADACRRWSNAALWSDDDEFEADYKKAIADMVKWQQWGDENG